MLVYGMGVVNGMWCYFPVWGVTKRDGVLTFRDGLLVHGMVCWYTGWCVTFRDGVLVYGIVC